MPNKKYKVLCYTDHDRGRDVEMLIPLRYFAEKYLNCKFIQAFIYDEHAIYRYKPDLVVLPNTIGSHTYFDISKYAHEQGIKVFALDSEGNFRTDGSFDFWGFNADKVFYQSFLCMWSERTQKYMQNQLPEIRDKIVVTGGVGFDFYQYGKFEKRVDYLKKKNLQKFRKVVGYAGWAFGKIYYEQGRDSLVGYFKGDKTKLDLIEPQRVKVETILKGLIENNPDVLFILKPHPTEKRPTEIQTGKNEISELKHYENVVYENDFAQISDLINISDIWMTFESTTAMEAWLLGKYTLLIRPDIDFSHTIIDKGLYYSQPVIKNYGSAQKYIDEFFNTGCIEEFISNDMNEHRNKTIRDSIGFGDGFNHIRAAYYLVKTLKLVDNTKDQIKYKLRLKFFVRYILILLGIFFYNRSIYQKLYKAKKFIWVFEQYNLKNVEVLYARHSKYLDEFYQKNKIKYLLESNKLFEKIIC